ncbi:hypothetical protein EB796_004994 [Bugula neritina]|uniref:Uncharacterized protein n=1 Tax=Bugula neritina TaxID=10212 RepID=A0A7J7JAZ3_BUGNE|nr:hypothetical protein EB796_018903 [Bugula neritina]KAF6036699.1 hypothetical protein EB796_004994 [Bugula neritina]
MTPHSTCRHFVVPAVTLAVARTCAMQGMGVSYRTRQVSVCSLPAANYLAAIRARVSSATKQQRLLRTIPAGHKATKQLLPGANPGLYVTRPNL